MDISLPVTLAVLGAALLHATWNALLKSSNDKQLDTVAIAVGGGLISLVVAPWLPMPAPASWPWLAASAVVHIFYFLFLAGAYRWGALSYTYPIMRGGGPMIVAVTGVFFFAEMPSLNGAIAIALICAGILGFATGVHDRRATWFALANAVVIASYTLIDAKGARLSGAPVAYTLWFFIANGVVIYALYGARRGAEVPRYLARHWGRT
ncbi:MAG TPA: EamA family transporter, partial [Burkholderiales bacterium]